MPDRSSVKRQCPRCTSRSLVLDYDDDPRKERAHAFLCLSCGRRFTLAPAQSAPAPAQAQ